MTYNVLRRHGAALVWSDMHRHMHPVVTSDFACLQLSGSNDKAWVEKAKEQAEQERLDFVAILVDSPVKANEVVKMLGLPEEETRRQPATSRGRQKGLAGTSGFGVGRRQMALKTSRFTQGRTVCL